MGLEAIHALPPRIECGHLRSAIRACFTENLSVVQELSIKTSQKLEKSFCRVCESARGEREFNKWKEERFLPQPVDEDHLSIFAAQFGRNVDQGWNQGKWPYIPNGHACLGHARSRGGTWNKGKYSEEVEALEVVSSGKPRIVTLHSEYNTSVLSTLHKSLYGSLKRKGWLLVGAPTDDKVASLNGGGSYVSVDYSSATDNIKTIYTQAAIEVLISKSVGLNDSDIRVLRAVGRPTIDGKIATRLQPMGSMMSFPLLCLINKTTVDLAHNDMLESGDVSFKEWTSHRCLINGDDLLYRDFEKLPGKLLDRIEGHGRKIGLVINREKTMVCPERGEINSTVFLNGEEEKKINLSALFMGPEVNDVLGFAYQASITAEGFRVLVRRNRHMLAAQKVKLQCRLPGDRYEILRRDKTIRTALLARFRQEPTQTNFFPVVTKPDGYELDRLEEIALIDKQVEWLRDRYFCDGVDPRKGQDNNKRPEEPFPSLRKALKREPPAEEKILQLLADGWKENNYKLLREDCQVYSDLVTTVCGDHIYSSTIARLVCMIKSYRTGQKARKEGMSERPLPIEGDSDQVPGDEGFLAI